MSDALTNLDSNLSGEGGATAYIGQVYLGVKDIPGFTTQSPTGVTYTVKPRKGENVISATQAKALYLTDPAVESAWLQTLKKNGLPTDKIKARAMWNLSVDGASDWFATSNGTQKITPEQYITWYAGGQKKGPSLPSRSIYEYTPEQLGAKIDDVAKSLLGRAITADDKAASWYQDLNNTLNKMVMQGTVTTTKQVKNPQTGKMENVTIQKPEVTTEGITQTITSALSQADPASLERKKNLDFANWAFKKMGGGQ